MKKRLLLNPQGHEIDLYASELDEDCFKLIFELGGTTGDIYLSYIEAEKIGKWFLQASKGDKK